MSSHDHAEGEENESANTTARDRRVYWTVLVSALVIFVNESRAVQFFISVFLIFCSFGIVYGNAVDWTLAAVGILFPFLLIQSLQVLIFLGKKLNVSDDDLNLDAFEICFERIIYSVNHSNNVKSLEKIYCDARMYLVNSWKYIKSSWSVCYRGAVKFFRNCKFETLRTRREPLAQLGSKNSGGVTANNEDL
jgi:hypothetical protein